MDTKYYLLGNNITNRFEKVIRIVFGVVCITVAIFWFTFNIKALEADKTLWITIIFLSGFGFYQIWSGLGRTTRFIEFIPGEIRLKRNPVLPAIKIVADEVEKLELFPLNIIFFLKTQKKIMLRLGATYQETNEVIKDEILNFAVANKIQAEIKVEEVF